MPVFQPYTCRDIRKATDKPENEHGARVTLKDENPIGLTTCSRTSVPNSIGDSSRRIPDSLLFTNWLHKGRWFPPRMGSAVNIRHTVNPPIRDLPRVRNSYGSTPFL